MSTVSWAILAALIVAAPPLAAFFATLIAPRHRQPIAVAASVPPGLVYLGIVIVAAVTGGDQGDNEAGAGAVLLLPILALWIAPVWGLAVLASWLRGVPLRPSKEQSVATN